MGFHRSPRISQTEEAHEEDEESPEVTMYAGSTTGTLYLLHRETNMEKDDYIGAILLSVIAGLIVQLIMKNWK